MLNSKGFSIPGVQYYTCGRSVLDTGTMKMELHARDNLRRYRFSSCRGPFDLLSRGVPRTITRVITTAAPRERRRKSVGQSGRVMEYPPTLGRFHGASSSRTSSRSSGRLSIPRKPRRSSGVLSPEKKNRKPTANRNVGPVPRSRHLLIEQDLMVDCGGTENLTTASHRGRRGRREAAGRVVVDFLPLFHAETMHAARHPLGRMEGGALIVQLMLSVCCCSLEELLTRRRPNSRLRNRAAIVDRSRLRMIERSCVCARRFPFGTRTLDDKRSPITYRGMHYVNEVH